MTDRRTALPPAIRPPAESRSFFVGSTATGAGEPTKNGGRRKPRAVDGTRRRRRSRVLLPLLGSAVAIAALFVGVFPTRAVLTQRADLDAAESTLATLDAENAALEARIDALGTDAEIERIARQQYNLVYPGEEAYAMLPAPVAATGPDGATGPPWPLAERVAAAAQANP
jgi:cell division protein FtsB